MLEFSEFRHVLFLYLPRLTLEICTLMSQPDKNPSAQCGGQCERCSVVEKGAEMAADPNAQGWRLVFSSAVVFLIPLGFTVAGAAVFRNDKTQQLLGALGGFAVGVILARLVTALVTPSRKSN